MVNTCPRQSAIARAALPPPPPAPPPPAPAPGRVRPSQISYMCRNPVGEHVTMISPHRALKHDDGHWTTNKFNTFSTAAAETATAAVSRSDVGAGKAFSVLRVRDGYVTWFGGRVSSQPQQNVEAQINDVSPPPAPRCAIIGN